MDLTNHFGINVLEQFNAWFHGEFAENFAARFPGKSMTLIVLNPDETLCLILGWDTPDMSIMFEGHQGPAEVAEQPGGTRENVLGKLRYVLRTMDDSVQAEIDYARIRPGDFPWQGAGEHSGYIGGVSGLAKEEDWELFCFCIDKLDELLYTVGRAAVIKVERLRKAGGNDPRLKYLNVTLTEDEIEQLSADVG